MTKTVNNFKIGDTVKIISGNGGGNAGLNLGSTTVVSDLGPYYVYVNGEDKHSGLGMVPNNLEVVKTATPAAPAVDFSKPVQTRDGRKVTLVTTEGRGTYPVLAYIENNESISTFTSEGAYYAGSEDETDIINVPSAPRIVVKYFNLYDDNTVGSKFDTREEADQAAANAESSSFRSAKRIAVQKVVFTEGQFDA